MTTTVQQGATVMLMVNWVEYVGGPSVNVTGVKIAIGGVLAATSTGVVHAALGTDTYAWAVPSGQALGDYIVTWTGTDPDSDAVSATEVVTVTASSATDAYATVADWTSLVGTAPSNAGRLLYLASADIDRALTASVYDATDPVIIDALRRATVEQAAWRVANGYTEGITGRRAVSASIGSAQVSYGSANGGGTDASGTRELGEMATAILARAGLTGGAPITNVLWW